MTSPPFIQFEDISKIYPNGTTALSGVSFSVQSGALHAICGENGAGKSTLMKLLFGLEQPSSGRLLINGEPTLLGSPRDAAAQGIGMVHQHFSLLPSLTVAENVVLGFEPRIAHILLDRKKARATVRALSERYGLSVDPDIRVASLSVAMQQKVEILKALSRNVRLLILDEPTAVLTPVETMELFDRLRALNATGVTILFISHKLKEVRALAGSITVLRGGKVSHHAPLQNVTDVEITRFAMGQAISSPKRDVGRAVGSVKLLINGVSSGSPHPGRRVSDFSLKVRAGEVVGVAGVDGAGQEGLVNLLTGEAEPESGEISLNGRQIGGLEKSTLRKLGLAHLPADRFRVGSAPGMNLIENAIAGAHRSASLSNGPLLRRAACSERTRQMISAYDIRCKGPTQLLGTLSGGNAQKLIAAREFGSHPQLLIAEEPTRGIDALAASYIHTRLLELVAEGVAVLLFTSDLDELLSLSDRIVVMHAGKIVSRFDNHEGLLPEHLGPAMLGLEAHCG